MSIISVLASNSYYYNHLRQPDFKIKSAAPGVRIMMHFFAMLCMSVASLSPIMGIIGVKEQCTKVSDYRAQSIIDAANEYQLDYGVYPDDVRALIPDYILKVPSPFCMTLTRIVLNQSEFDYTRSRITKIRYHDMGLIRCYSFESDSWSSTVWHEGGC